MKKYILSLLILGLMASTSCNSKKEEAQTEIAETGSEEWKEMDSFHMIMAESFHPYKDSSNLEPAKKMAEEMATEAEKWASASLPSKVNTHEVKQQLEKLKTDTRAFADKIKSGSADAEIGSSLTALHDSFHGIMEAWHGGGEKHEHEGGEEHKH
jgi:Tfp pilus assembly protein PilP